MLKLSKISLFSLIIYSCLFSLNSKLQTLKASANTISICPGLESSKIYSVPTANNSTSCPNADSEIIYVSPLGDDTNDGLSPNSPVKSLSKAVKLTRRNSPDWVVLKRGETFNDSFGVIRYRQNELPLGGQSIDKPLVITTYGESLERPIIKPEKNGIELWGKFQNITISGLEFSSDPGTGGIGIRTLYEGKNYVIHNNYISGFNTAIILQGNDKKNQWLSKVLIKDNILVNSASSGKGHSQGIYAQIVKNLTIDGNVLDTCGWYKDRNGQLPNSRIATIFNHCLYLQKGGYPATIKNNIITRASSHGLQARSGAFVENNLFARNPIQFFISSKGLNGNANVQHMWAKNNVVLEGNDINYQLSRGVGIEHNNAYSASYENNTIAHVLSLSKFNKKAINIICKTNDVYTSISGQCQSKFKANFVYNWGTEFDGFLLSAKNFNTDLIINHQIVDNYFAIANTGAKFIDVRNETLEGKYTFRRNTYNNSQIMEQDLFSLPKQSKVPFLTWKSTIEPTAEGLDYGQFSDPCRTMATYYDDFILGDLEDNCEILHDNDLFEQFIELAKEKNAMIENSGVDVDSVIEYVREGFALLPSEPPLIYYAD